MVKANSKLHAIERGPFGRRALCGAGRIVLPSGEPFQRTDRLACPDCLSKALAD
jgi:hypothetical protein